MAMSITGTNLAVTAVDSYRKMRGKLEVKWDGVNWTDETSDPNNLISADCPKERIVLPWQPETAWPFTADFKLKSLSDRYSYFNSSSPLYSYISSNQGHGIQIRFFIGFWDAAGSKWDYLQQFDGYIIYIEYSTRNNDCTLHCKDRAFRQTQNRSSTTMYLNKTVKEWLTILCGADLGDIS